MTDVKIKCKCGSTWTFPTVKKIACRCGEDIALTLESRIARLEMLMTHLCPDKSDDV